VRKDDAKEAGWAVAIAVAVIATMALLWVGLGAENDRERLKDAQRDYEDILDLPLPTVTETVTKTPPPPPPKTVIKTVKVTVEPARASRSQSRGVGDKATLACIRKHESGNDYRDVSATGKFRGAYQFHRGYAPVWAERAGYGNWSNTPSDRWPPAVQDAVAYDMGHGNRYAAWDKHTSYNCPGFR
jgi:hypothetical protein